MSFVDYLAFKGIFDLVLSYSSLVTYFIDFNYSWVFSILYYVFNSSVFKTLLGTILSSTTNWTAWFPDAFIIIFKAVRASGILLLFNPSKIQPAAHYGCFILYFNNCTAISSVKIW